MRTERAGRDACVEFRGARPVQEVLQAWSFLSSSEAEVDVVCELAALGQAVDDPRVGGELERRPALDVGAVAFEGVEQTRVAGLDVATHSVVVQGDERRMP